MTKIQLPIWQYYKNKTEELQEVPEMQDLMQKEFRKFIMKAIQEIKFELEK